jgi:hypothetical protein
VTDSSGLYEERGTMQRTQSKFRRRDGSGHLDPTYESTLRAASGSSTRGGEELAFLGRRADPVAEERGSGFVINATTGQDDAQEGLDRTHPDEEGGPFVETNAAIELSYD